MEIYIVTHKHESDDPESCYKEIVSGHLNREKAELSVKETKEHVLSKFWTGRAPDDIDVVHDFSGLFEIRDITNGDRDEVLINTVKIKD